MFSIILTDWFSEIRVVILWSISFIFRISICFTSNYKVNIIRNGHRDQFVPWIGYSSMYRNLTLCGEPWRTCQTECSKTTECPVHYCHLAQAGQVIIIALSCQPFETLYRMSRLLLAKPLFYGRLWKLIRRAQSAGKIWFSQSILADN